MGTRVFASVDLGATSVRVMAGALERDRIELHEIDRIPNGPSDRDGHLRWDVTSLYGSILAGLQRVPEAESIAIDGWGVDYGLLDEDGHLLAEPISYRDGRTAEVIDEVHARVTPSELYSITGTQFLRFNTIYQIAAEQRESLWSQATHAVLLPDLIAYWLTGELGSEVTNASTTGLLDLAQNQWSLELFNRLEIPDHLFAPIQLPGSTRGATELGTPVITVCSHDTASAVVGVPAISDRFAFISSGTWSLVGLELEHPILTEEARHANFTNEVGVDGRTRFLQNVGGLWLLEECLREWGTMNRGQLLQEAAVRSPGGPVIDPDDPTLISPGNMPARISKAMGIGENSAQRSMIVRCILDSLAAGYARTLAQASALAKREIDVVHIVGGGSQIGLLCQLTANVTGLPVMAGPSEATTFGNVIVQARSRGACPPSIEAMRAQLADFTMPRRYEPE